MSVEYNWGAWEDQKRVYAADPDYLNRLIAVIRSRSYRVEDSEFRRYVPQEGGLEALHRSGVPGSVESGCLICLRFTFSDGSIERLNSDYRGSVGGYLNDEILALLEEGVSKWGHPDPVRP